MAKLSATKREYALKDIRSGMTTPELVVKYQVSASAISYLRKKANGSTPKMLEFKARLGVYCPDRIKRLYLLEQVSAQDLAKDYEVSTAIMKEYLSEVAPMAKSTKRIVIRGANKTKTKKKK
jgi:predicted nucleic acid-binding protein